MAALARLFLGLMVAVMLGHAPARAQAYAAEEYAAFRAVVQTQIEALRHDDFAGAYAVTAPSMKALYPSLQAFTQIMRNRYAQLIRPKSVVFGTVVKTSQGPVQRVFITANDGRSYVASFSLQRQPDDTWLIAGCTIARDNGSSAV